jgi:hypothetical protein
MRRKQWLGTSVFSCAGLFLIGLSAPLLRGQEAQPPAVPTAQEQDANSRVLMDLVRDLQRQVNELNHQLKEVRQEHERERSQNEELLKQVQAIRQELVQASPGAGGVQNMAGGAPEQGPTTEQRLGRMEEAQELTDGKLRDLNQTKVESASKYRVRLTGIVLLNLFSTRGSVDYQDVPQIATHGSLLSSDGSFGGSFRQSQIGLDGFGPEIWGAKTSGSVKFDFAGGFPGTPNGGTQGLVRLRTGVVRLDWENTSLIAGQDSLFLSPLAPSSLASLAVPALAYSGNLWSWTPQVRVEHRFQLGETSKLLLQGAVMDNLTGDVPGTNFATNATTTPSFGERSGQPAYAVRIAWTHGLWGQSMTFGSGGYYSRQDWGFGRTVDGWAGTLDLALPLGRVVEFDGEFYRGRALGGLAGGIGQTAIWHSPLSDPLTQVYGLDSMGGWAQLKFKVTPKLELNGAFGQDNPFASELRTLGGNVGFYNEVLSRNLTPMANVIYRPRSNLVTSVEYRYLRTYPLDSLPNTAHHVDLSVGYIF